MAGAPAQQDLFDYKPKMKDWFDKDLPETVRDGQRLTTMTSGQKRFPIAPSIYNFKQHGQSGAWVSELLPHTAQMVDDITVVKSMWTRRSTMIRPSPTSRQASRFRGDRAWVSWLSYGLGSDNEDLPAFVVLNSSWSGRKEAQALYERSVGKRIFAIQTPGCGLAFAG
jgi:hypothetical protein